MPKMGVPGRPSKAAKAIRELNPRVGRPAVRTEGAVLAKAFRRLSDLSGPAFQTLERAVNDETHPQHLWATQFVLERLATRKTFEAIADATFAGPGGSSKPSINIVINGSAPKVEQVIEPMVIEHEDAEAAED